MLTLAGPNMLIVVPFMASQVAVSLICLGYFLFVLALLILRSTAATKVTTLISARRHKIAPF